MAEPTAFDEAWEDGRFPFFAQEPYYEVDLEAIPVGTKMAALIAMDALSRE